MKTVRAVAYPGAKIKQVRDLTCFLPDGFREIIEPFAGSASLTMHLRAKGYVRGSECWLNDTNAHLMNLYRVLQSSTDSLVSELLRVYEQHGKGNRDLFQDSLDTINNAGEGNLKKAVAYFIHNQLAYMRVQKFTPSAYSQAQATKDGIKEQVILRLLWVSKRLADVRLTVGTYENVLHMAKKDSFLFLDPPYTDTKAYENPCDLQDFADACAEYKNKCFMMITLDDTPENRSRFAKTGFVVFSRRVYYSSSKDYANELMIINYEPALLDRWSELTGYKQEKGVE